VVIAHRPALVELADIVLEVRDRGVFEVRRNRVRPESASVTSPSPWTTAP
jgi:hypothetical protein